MSYSGIAFAPGACGELIQGQFPKGEDFLVSLPVDIWSKAEISITENSQDILISPVGKVKTALAVRLLLDKLDLYNAGAEIYLESAVPEAKGLASSTADITAACLAVGKGLDLEILPSLISKIAREIEPSDGIMYPGLVVYNHRNCDLIEVLGKTPIFKVLILDFGGEVITLDYNPIPKAYSDEEKINLEFALDEIKEGIQTQNWKLIGGAAIRSGRINQRFLYKPYLEKVISIAKLNNAFGVCIAHSGTVVGILFGFDANLEGCKKALYGRFGREIELIETKTINIKSQ